MSRLNVFNKVGLLLFLAIWSLVSVASPATARDRDKDTPERRARNQESASKTSFGSCVTGTASADLDINNVRARLFNSGSLFYSASDQAQYEVPKGSGLSPIFAHGIWMGGMAGDELRMAAATYAQFGETFEFFPGPLAADGTPPADCNPYDRLFKVSRMDIENYNATGQATQDMLDWPYQLGAPVTDGDGNPNNYDLAGGDRPAIIGDQTIWWVMNDAAGEHLTTMTNPMGMEVQVTAFAFQSADALNNTTFYKYKFIYKPRTDVPLDSVYVGLFSDPDLGNPTDDFVGSDTTLGLGYVYNGDPFDETNTGYQDRPPAMGYDFFQGPLVPAPGETWTDPDGTVHHDATRLKMTKFVYYNNTNGIPTGNPDDAADYYGYLRGYWTDNTRITFGGDGYGGQTYADFMFPGDPPAYWSEDNTDGAGARNVPADRRFVMSTGPFTMQPGDVQEIVFGIVWSQTRDRIGSVKQLKADDLVAQGAFDFNFNIPRPPDAPELTAVEMDESIILKWSNPPSSNNYLNQYDVESPFLVDPSVDNKNYRFEGYKVYQYPSFDVAPEDGTLIATLDVENGVTTIVDSKIDPETGAPVRVVTARGTDTGVKDFFVVDKDYINDQELRNFTEYYFGVQAYAYNPFSDPQIRQSPIVRIKVVPSKVTNRNGGTVLQSEPLASVAHGTIDKISDAIISARVIDPLKITGDSYNVRFYDYDPDGEEGELEPVLTYDVVNSTTNKTILGGEAFYKSNNKPVPFGEDIFVAEGLSFTIKDAPADFAGGGAGIIEVAWAGEPVPTDAAGAPYGGNSVWHGLNSNADYYVSGGGAPGDLERLKRWITFAAPRDFELRFTEEGGYAVYAFTDDKIARVPFEIWDIGISTPDDPSDDRRMIPFLVENDETKAEWGWATGTDPYFGFPASDLIYWMDPETPDGYEKFVENVERSGGPGAIYDYANDGSTYGYWTDMSAGFVYPIGRMIFGDYSGDGVPPPPGTVVRLITTKPPAAGDVFTINTAEFAPATNQFANDSLRAQGLELIQVVPNPYRGASAFDVSVIQDQVRITNLPQNARIRVFSLSGVLVYEDVHRSSDPFYRWDLTNMDGLPIASGMYLIHIEVPGIGERVLKFGVVKNRPQLDIL